MEDFARHAETVAAAKVEAVAAVEERPAMPEMPAHLVRCVRYGLGGTGKQAKQARQVAGKQKAKAAGGKADGEGKSDGKVAGQGKASADGVVLTALKRAEEQQKCAVALLRWYGDLKKANDLAGKKV
jgi:hypothetical protein